MKFKRIYFFSRANKKYDETDYICGYESENGVVINTIPGYEVNGVYFETLKQAKEYVRSL